MPGRTQIRLSAATGNGNQEAATAIELANDDMPFLVDSTLNVLNELGYPIQFVLHPIIAVRRDARGKLIEVLAPGSTAESTSRRSQASPSSPRPRAWSPSSGLFRHTVSTSRFARPTAGP